MAVIQVKNLNVIYMHKKQTVRALDDFCAEFTPGINVVIGYSGCGKTTLLRAVAGLIDYDGEIFLDENCIDDVPTQKRNMAYVSQQYVLYSNKTIFDNIAFPLKMKGAGRKEIEETVSEIGEVFNLTHCFTRLPRHLSGGQKQLTAVARALVKRPSVCLMDEPLSNVDVQKRTDIRIKLKSFLKGTGCTTIYVTHDMDEAFAVADKIFVMAEGKLEVCGKAAEILASKNKAVRALCGDRLNGRNIYK